MQASEIETGIVVRRANDLFGLVRLLKVYIDGQFAGSVAYGGRAEFELPPGRYSIQVWMDWTHSKPYEVDLQWGDVDELEAGVQWRGLLWGLGLFAGLFTPHRFFV